MDIFDIPNLDITHFVSNVLNFSRLRKLFIILDIIKQFIRNNIILGHKKHL